MFFLLLLFLIYASFFPSPLDKVLRFPLGPTIAGVVVVLCTIVLALISRRDKIIKVCQLHFVIIVTNKIKTIAMSNTTIVTNNTDL